VHKTTEIWTRSLVAATAVLSFAGFAACRNSGEARQAAGAVDTAVARTTTDVPAEGPAVQVTRTDQKSVDKATEYKLTDDNFTHFIAAADSIAALRGRDDTVNQFLSQNLDDAAARTSDAGLTWLESNAAVSNAINSAGISTRDYFVAAIAIASAERFMNEPNAAPPTPTTKGNAEFLRGHQAELDQLRALRENKPVVIVKP
jgi:hypothetical protein